MVGNLGARQHFWFTARRAARQNHQQHRAGIPAAAATTHISEPPNPAEALLLSPSPPPETPGRPKNTHRPKTPTDREPPPSENAKIHRPAPPATPGPAPASTTSIGSPFGTSPPCTGRRRPACKVPIMTAAHSGTPAAVFVCQHPHSTANLRQNQYPHPEMRKILLAVCRTPARGQELRIPSRTRATTVPPPQRREATWRRRRPAPPKTGIERRRGRGFALRLQTPGRGRPYPGGGWVARDSNPEPAD